MKEKESILYGNENESEYKVEYIGKVFSDKKKIYKINILGINGVGKSGISFRILNNKFNEDSSPTISIDVGNFQVKVNEQIIQFQIWDSCGNEEFAQSTPNLFRDTSLAIIVYAINDRKSFFAVEKWNNILNQYSFECIKYLIGNKSDLEDERVVQKEEGEALKDNYDFNLFLETSGKTGFNITNLLNAIAISIYQKEKKLEEENELISNGGRISLNNEFDKTSKKKKKRKCC
jgi:small GTP-binding protein